MPSLPIPVWPAKPRMRTAARLYATGAVKTKREAAEAAGISPSSFYARSSQMNGHPDVIALIDETDRDIHSGAVNMSKVLAHLGIKALARINQLMDHSQSEKVQLEAAKDLADRSPNTSKTFKAEISGSPIEGEDAKRIAAAMVEAAKTRSDYRFLASSDFVKLGPPQEPPVPEPAPTVENPLIPDAGPPA